MRDWNVVVTVRDGGFARACRLLQQFGPVSKTAFYNVLLLRVEEVHRLLEGLHQRISEDPGILDYLAHVMPVTQTFTFQSAEEFEIKAREEVLARASELFGKAFHVCLHRRGFKGRLTTPQEERLIAEALLEATAKAGAPARITFEDPDAIVTIETIGNQAGVAIWTRADWQRYSFLGRDGGRALPPPVKALPRPTRQVYSGWVDVTGIMPEDIRIDPNLTEGHPGYEESGESEIIPNERFCRGEAPGGQS